MRKIIGAMNISLDGFCDHTAMNADEQLHEHFAALLEMCDTVLYGRITYKLMEDYWPSVVSNPTGSKSTDDFAVALENIDKLVFSRTLTTVSWKNTRLATSDLETAVLELKRQSGRPVLVGSPSLISALTKFRLIDEYQLCVHPVITGGGLPLFKDIPERTVLKLLNTKSFGSGVIAQYYESANV